MRTLLRLLRERSPSTEVVILTGQGTIEKAVRTVKDGAYDFLTKPCNLDELEAVVPARPSRSVLW